MSGPMRLIALAAFCTVALAGCPLPVPPLGYSTTSRDNLPDRVPAFIVKGTTTREDMLLALGTPDARSPDERWFAWRSERHTGGVVFIVAAGTSAGGAGVVGYQERLLMVRFDERALVVDATLEDRLCPRGVIGLGSAGGTSAACLKVPELAAGPSAELLALMAVHVVTAEGEARGIDRLIAAELRRNGLDATVGPANEAPANVDAVVTYRDTPDPGTAGATEDLTIVVQAPGAAKVLALASARRAPASGKTPEAMVEEAVTRIFAGPGKPFLTLPPHSAPATSAAVGAGKASAIRIEPVRDARTAPRGKFIGERTALGVSLGRIDMAPMPVKAIGQWLGAELARAGHRSDGSDADVVLEPQLTRFEVRTPSTMISWDVQGTIAIDLGVVQRGTRGTPLHYEAACTERTYSSLSEALIGRVVLKCLDALAVQLRQDLASGRLPAAP